MTLEEQIQLAKDKKDRELLVLLRELETSRVRIKDLERSLADKTAAAYSAQEALGDVKSGAYVILNRMQEVLDNNKY
jgi:hypothetical protein